MGISGGVSALFFSMDLTYDKDVIMRERGREKRALSVTFKIICHRFVNII
jgi:hypothetical protein